ncbi:carbohydrate-binding module family 1 protein [Massariosphaeria phaeospora]|uniref:Carbohydrate-binding module family 1 protein n=1 Tax=Massariosphaeria phaeospora TaxID=100035 RepID=A0A7C8I1B5_9PLEO|nr:carbohydrate-binding module family 1 protein [Massariosphaeria phaeospora]
MHHFSAALVVILVGTASAVVQDWQQCGGKSWSGDSQCATGSGCVVVNDYYSQCQPGAVPQPEPQPEPEPQPPAATSIVLPGTPVATNAPSGTGPGKTLQSGYYWIRGVAAPNFHKYMQTKPLYSTGAALLGDYTTAGQFQIVDSQLVQLVSGAGEKPEKLLYGIVSETRYINNMSLSVTFSEAKNSYGKFAWNGDGLTWSVAGLQRPNAAAWYVCTGQQMYINLGNYLYQTPAGCADQTIHYYNDKTANN